MRRGPLRRRLFVLTAAGIVPLALMAGTGLYFLQRQQSAQAERSGLELARSVANAVDAELRRSVAAIETLATSLTLDRGEIAGFRGRAERVIATQPEWAAILLTDASGTTLLDTRVPEGAALTPPVDMESFERARDSQRPAISGLSRHERHPWTFAVRVPVTRDGTVRYVVTALVKPDAVRDALTRQHVPDDWLISIVDANGLRVARSRAHEENLGGRLSETAQQVVAQGGNEGIGISTSLEGLRIYTPYARLGTTGWTAVLGIPTTVVEAAAFRSLATYGAGVLLSIVLGTLGALWVARSIAAPMASLRAAAEALGRRQPVAPPATSIEEIREVGVALTTAAAELARVEAEREDLLRKEREAREAAEVADRSKDEFMAVLSHELRTPLNAVFGWARMLEAGQVRDETMVRRAHAAIVRNADLQVQLIDDLLDLSRISSGKMRLELGVVDLPSVLTAAVEAVRPAAAAKRIELHLAMAPEVGVVTGDAARLQQIAGNLLTNAVKFTPDGGRVDLRARASAASVQIEVQDTGQGIAPAMLPHVFERFRQGDSSSTRTQGGLGLGLSLVKHLVELHHGTVTATSDGVGHGATFVVALPLARAASGAGADGGDADAPLRGLVRLDGLRVLLVDDDRDAATLAEVILVAAGATVRTTLAAKEAFAELSQWRPDVLVCDIEMPGEDGFSLIHRIRALAAADGGETPAIALTAYGRSQDRARALAAGFAMHVPKPVDPGELTAIVAGIAGVAEAR